MTARSGNYALPACGGTAIRALALRFAADCIDHGVEIPAPFTKVFSVA